MRIAAFDLGSNSFHLLVVDAHADGTFVPLIREKDMLRLGDAVGREGRIPDALADRAVATVDRFRKLALGAGTEEIHACATAALREAENGGQVVDRMEAEAGVKVRVISGHEEAQLIFQAVKAAVVIDPGPALCLDLGGGSLEVMVGDSSRLHLGASVQLGVARLSAELVTGDPYTADDVRRLEKRVTSVLAPLADDVARLHPAMAVGSSGTFCDLARMIAARRTGNVPKSVNQFTFSREELLPLHEELLAKRSSERAPMPGLEAKRADIIPTGSIVLLTAMELFGFDRMTVSEWALREGIVLDVIPRREAADWSRDPRAIRATSVLQLARRCNWDEGHGRHTARLALDLFDQTAELHRLGAGDRELLEHAGLLHDIGEHVSTESHHKHSAYLIQHGKLRGFTPVEVDFVAALARAHRGGNPKPSHEPFGTLDPEARERVSRLAALLRVADGLDRGRCGNVKEIKVLLDGDRARLVVRSDTDIAIELWGARRKRELFERLFRRRLAVVPG
ncbi:MAG TPA: Ppx/GppA phosphatase family protein [Acidimicrobiales bacterium]|nr:Ppx/GppA phosphatase family protein [Acidimicrobiales bacterium]